MYSSGGAIRLHHLRSSWRFRLSCDNLFSLCEEAIPQLMEIFFTPWPETFELLPLLLMLRRLTTMLLDLLHTTNRPNRIRILYQNMEIDEVDARRRRGRCGSSFPSRSLISCAARGLRRDVTGCKTQMIRKTFETIQLSGSAKDRAQKWFVKNIRRSRLEQRSKNAESFVIEPAI